MALYMDPAIWSELPSDLLLYNVLPCLSFFHGFSLRTVCHNWNHILTTKSYMEIGQAKPASSLLFEFHADSKTEEFTVYDHSTDAWKLLPKHLFIPKYLMHKGRYVPVASAGGLVCWLNRREHVALSICNPVLNKWIDLPKFPFCIDSKLPDSDNDLGGLFCMSANEGRFVVLVHDLKAYVCDTTLKSWTMFFSIWRFKFTRLSAVVIGFHVYILDCVYSCGHGSRDGYQPYCLWKYDILQKRIDLIQQSHDMDDHNSFIASRLPHVLHALIDAQNSPIGSRLPHLKHDYCAYPKIFELNGHVMMFAFNRKLVQVWMLDTNSMAWSLFQCTKGPPSNTTIPKAIGNFIYQDHNWFYFLQDTEDSYDAFDVQQNQWRKICKSPSQMHGERRLFTFR